MTVCAKLMKLPVISFSRNIFLIIKIFKESIISVSQKIICPCYVCKFLEKEMDRQFY